MVKIVTKYQASQNGVIGITLNSHWFEPLSEEKENKNAALRALDFMLGWFAEPLTSGDYPQSMRSLVGGRLPKFTKEQSKLLIGSFDFLGLNYYTGYYASDAPQNNSVYASFATDYGVNLSSERNGVPIGPKGASEWLNIYPQGIQHLLLYTKKKYHNPIIYITENGWKIWEMSVFPGRLPKFQQKVSSLFSKWTRHQYDVKNIIGFVTDSEEFGAGPVNLVSEH
ncbi:cyanogenic beta-glucosidase-like [Prunus avium]|uniref:Cyanogenic beta-glucosidase-like n=1 Tax=Prunus avium TaxID=42229 RepID=A0A6P5TQI4_PRUAV|nr:cyanogenic beta-glucosidase-like [Prunus avium]